MSEAEAEESDQKSEEPKEGDVEALAPLPPFPSFPPPPPPLSPPGVPPGMEPWDRVTEVDKQQWEPSPLTLNPYGLTGRAFSNMGSTALFIAMLLFLANQLRFLFFAIIEIFLPVRAVFGLLSKLKDKLFKIKRVNRVVIDPPFSEAIAGTIHPSVRKYKNRFVRLDMIVEKQSRWLIVAAVANSLGLVTTILKLILFPTRTMFILLKLNTEERTVTAEKYEDAEDVQVKIVGESNMSYEPEFHPRYKKAISFVMADAATTLKADAGDEFANIFPDFVPFLGEDVDIDTAVVNEAASLVA